MHIPTSTNNASQGSSSVQIGEVSSNTPSQPLTPTDAQVSVVATAQLLISHPDSTSQLSTFETTSEAIVLIGEDQVPADRLLAYKNIHDLALAAPNLQTTVLAINKSRMLRILAEKADRDLKQLTPRIQMETTGAIVFSASVGLAVGSIGGPPGMAIGALLGAIIGFFAGLSISIKYHTFKISYSSYDQLIQQKKGDTYKKLVLAFFEADPKLKDLICPLSKEIIHSPVRTPSGNFYNKNPLMQWVKEKGHDPKSRDIKLTVDEIFDAPEMMHHIVTRIEQITDNDAVYLEQFDPEIHKALKCIRADLLTSIHHQVKKLEHQLYLDLKNNKINMDVHNRKMRTLTNIYYGITD